MQIYCLVVIKFKKLTKHVEMEVIAEFTVAITKLASLDLIINPLIKFSILLQKQHMTVYFHSELFVSTVTVQIVYV